MLDRIELVGHAGSGSASGLADGTGFFWNGACSGYRQAHGITLLLSGRIDAIDTLRQALGCSRDVDVSHLILLAYAKWGGEEFAGHLYGDFAIIVWDEASRRLTLTRSPSGLRPLFYRYRDAKLDFATEPWALVGHGGVAIDEQAMAEWLVLQPQLSDHTLFTGIRRVPPGSTVTFERNRLTISRHWRPESLGMIRLRDHREYADLLRETLQVAVADRLCDTQGAIATQLSGGLDSSSVTVLAAEHLSPSNRQVLAFTAVPGPIGLRPADDRFLDEGEHAACVAARYDNIIHTRVAPNGASLFETLDRHTDVEGCPPFNPHHLQWIDRTYAAAAGAGATTLLSGSMGNTTISGAGAFALIDAVQHGHLAKAARLFLADRRSGTRRFGHLPGIVLLAFVPTFLDMTDRLRRHRMEVEQFTGLRSSFAIAQGIDPTATNRRRPFRDLREQAVKALTRFDPGMFHTTPRRLYGLEVSDPTLDRRVAELTLQIPIEQFCMDGIPRALIRTAMTGRLPEIVRMERRRGLQSADFLTMLQVERAAIKEELDRMAAFDILQRALDIPLLQERLAWSDSRIIGFGWHQYSNRLMRAISLGRFVRRVQDGPRRAIAHHPAVT